MPSFSEDLWNDTNWYQQPGPHLRSNQRLEIYERVARHEDLPGTLEMLARWVEPAAPGAIPIVYRLQDGRLIGYGEAMKRCHVLGAMNGLPAGGPDGAPWWRLNGHIEVLEDNPRWRAEVAAYGKAPAAYWSDQLQTAAGEVVGTLTLFLPEGVPPPEPDNPRVQEVRQLAAMAIEQANLIGELEYQARHDHLSGLWNRRQLEDELSRQLMAVGDTPSYLLWVEITGLNRVNQILGSRIGDLLLVQVARRIEACVRADDFLARTAGSEFGVLVNGRDRFDHPGSVADRLIGAFGRPFEIEDHELILAANVGICRVFKDGMDADTLVRHARMATEHARNRGRNICLPFETSMSIWTPERLEMERNLQVALERQEFSLHYQPQVRVSDSSLAGVEALLRWRQGDVGLVSPGIFIPLAEELGLIDEIGTWVLEEGCRQASLWERHNRPVRVSVNVAASQFGNPNFASVVRQMIEKYALDPALLELEVTESMVLGNRELAVAHLNEVRSIGVTVALDDFGTGHSSLSYLLDLPLDRLKIDRSFLREVGEAGDAPLLDNIVRMGRSLGLSVITEGVETQRQWDALRGMSCDEVQGFFISKPLPSVEFETWLEKRLIAQREGAERNQP